MPKKGETTGRKTTNKPRLTAAIKPHVFNFRLKSHLKPLLDEYTATIPGASMNTAVNTLIENGLIAEKLLNRDRLTPGKDSMYYTTKGKQNAPLKGQQSIEDTPGGNAHTAPISEDGKCVVCGHAVTKYDWGTQCTDCDRKDYGEEGEFDLPFESAPEDE